MILNVPVITGKKGISDTPTGTYTIKSHKKLRSKYLIGYKSNGTLDYKYLVDYWMPFNGNYGFHGTDQYDESNDFNKKTYIKNGSHGSINMRKRDAKKLYNGITKNIKVFIQD